MGNSGEDVGIPEWELTGSNLLFPKHHTGEALGESVAEEENI